MHPMYVLVVGGGTIGKGLVEQLSHQKHDVIVIDINEEVCEEIYAKFGAVTIIGNATSPDTLRDAGIERCDVAVAALGSDAENLAFAMLAKHFKVSQVIVKMNDPSFEEVYRTVGVKNISRGKELLISQIMLNIESPELKTIISFDNIEICLFMIPENAQCAGKTVENVVSKKGFPLEIVMTCVFDSVKHSYKIPRGNTVLNVGDRVFLCGTMKDIKEACKYLSE